MRPGNTVSLAELKSINFYKDLWKLQNIKQYSPVFSLSSEHVVEMHVPCECEGSIITGLKHRES